MIESEPKVDNNLQLIGFNKGGSFGFDVLKLVSGTTLSQLLLILSAPFLARLYLPEAFGVAALFTSITGILTVISCLGYEMAILLPEDDKDAANLLGLSFLIVAVISVFTIPIILIVGPGITNQLNVPELMPYLWLIPITTLLGGTAIGHPSLTFWNTRTKNFSRLSIIQVIRVIIIVLLQLIFGFLGYTSGTSLLGSTIIGSVASTIILGWLIWRENGRFFRSSITWSGMLTSFKRYRKFPLFESGAGLLNTISWQLPTFILAAYFSPVVVGYYSLGNRLLKTPMSFVSNSIGRVFFQRAAQAKVNGTLTSLVESVLRRLVIIGLFPMLLLSIIGEDLFIVIFGQDWSEAGIYTQILSLWAFFWFISSPLSNLFRVLEKQEFSLIINVVIIITRFIALWLGGVLGNARLALILFSISGILVYGYLSIAVILASGLSKFKVAKIIFSNVLLFAPFGVILITIKYLFEPSPIVTLGLSAIATGIYLVYFLKNDPQVLSLVVQSMNQIQGKIIRVINISH